MLIFFLFLQFLDTGDDFNDQGNATDYDHEGDETDSNAEFGPDDFFEHSEEVLFCISKF